MIVIKSTWFPPGFEAITLWPFIIHKDQLPRTTLNHENTHARQQLELLLVGFYLAYFVEWIFKGYDNISFEQEAYSHEQEDDYLKSRKPYAMWRK